MSTVPTPDWLTATLDALCAGDVEAMLADYADDAVHEVPLARPGRPSRLEGKPAIAEYLRQLPTVLKIDAFEDVVAREAGDEFIVEAKSHGTRPATGEPFRMQYIWFITRRDGRIARFRDYTVRL